MLVLFSFVDPEGRQMAADLALTRSAFGVSELIVVAAFFAFNVLAAPMFVGRDGRQKVAPVDKTKEE